ncbi:Zn-dependent hydrolase, RNA-metabolising [hydrothermal vent metagenome]|uniref:Zn-dependent hydrolase, RNA-metabolising n=1 Tax=hydrothermal vent metagenome TaxID=652676 RepID=A0A3B1E656_9ZZZZ
MEENIQQVQTSSTISTNTQIQEENKKDTVGKTIKPKRKVPTSGHGWTNDLKEAFALNENIQKERLNPNSRLNPKTDASIKITPLGGLGEIGGNMMVIETEKCAIIVDVGMSFPDESMHGVDILIPDFTYLRQIRNKIAGIIITHAHEDHIGAIPYFFKEIKVPVYGTALPLAMIGAKFDEHKMKQHRSYFRAIQKRKIIRVGEFDIEWMHITHSIIDSSSVAITCEAGTIIHSGDFKIDHTPYDGLPTDLHRFAHYGEKGVLAFLSDSTNSHASGFIKSELTVGPTFDMLFAKAKARIIMSTFSSNLHRVAQAIDRGIASGRKICVIGRSMEKNIDLAIEMGYLKYSKDKFIDAHEVNKFPDHQILIVTTGSQGEPMSALFRMSIHEHRHIKIKPEDLIILSAKAIPGNEASVSGLINQLQKAGAEVAYQNYDNIHVSGHAAQEEQKLLLRLTKPKYFLPIHGEYNHVRRHAQTGVSCGVEERNIFILSDGEQVEISTKSLKKVKTVKTGKTYIDNQKNRKISNSIIMDRQTMANEGIITIVTQICKADQKVDGPIKVASFGLVDIKQEAYLSKELEDLLHHFLEHIKEGLLNNTRALEEELRKVIRKHCIRKYRKYPMIVPTLIVQ